MFNLHRRLLAWIRARAVQSPALLRLLGLVIAVPASAGAYSPALRHGEIASADAFGARLTAGAVRTARVLLDPAKVPADLRGLVPLAQHWGICDDAIREAMQDAESQAHKDAMADAVNPHNTAITAWLDSLPAGEPMSEEAAAFMYMQLGLSEMALFGEE